MFYDGVKGGFFLFLFLCFLSGAVYRSEAVVVDFYDVAMMGQATGNLTDRHMLTRMLATDNAQKCHVQHSNRLRQFQERYMQTWVKSQWKNSAFPGHFLVEINTENHLADASVDPYRGCEPDKADYRFKWLPPERK